jgi:hypothetical protein
MINIFEEKSEGQKPEFNPDKYNGILNIPDINEAIKSMRDEWERNDDYSRKG